LCGLDGGVGVKSLPIHFAAVSDLNNDDDQSLFFILANNPVVANAIAPQPLERPSKRLGQLLWIFRRGNPFT